MNKVEVKFNRALYPYRQGQTAMMKEETAKKWESKGAVDIIDKKIKSKKNKSMAGNSQVENKSFNESELEDLQDEYEELYGKQAPNAYKNKPGRLQNKIEEKE